MKIVFMGTPSFAIPVLKALNEKYEVVLVISQPDRAKKKNQIIKTPVHEAADELGLKIIQPESIKDSYEELKEIEADILVTAAYGQYVPTKILKLYKHALNVHGSLLPKHRGGAPIQRCLINGDEKTGVTIIEMVKKLDGGKMYGMKEYDILDTDNNSTLFDKLSIIGRDLLLEVIEDVYNGINLGIEQDETLATFSSNIQREEEKICFNDTSKNVFNKIRGLSLEPGAYLEHKNIKLKVYASKVIDYNGNEQPGTVLCIKKKIVIKTIDGAIELTSVLMPGKKIMTGQEFSNGQKLFELNDILS